MRIEYIVEPIFNQPGPSLVWWGTPEEMGSFASKIEILASESDYELAISTSDSIHLDGIKKLIFRSRDSGNILSQIVDDDTFLCEVPMAVWSEILSRFRSLEASSGSSTQFIECDDRPDLKDEINWVAETR